MAKVAGFVAGIVCALLLISTSKATAANTAYEAGGAFVAPQGDEVLLTFRHRGVGNVYVTGFYDYRADIMFLPFSELFSLLQIYHQPSPGDFSISGNFLTPDKPFRVLFAQQRVVLDRREHLFEADDFRIGEMDYFASPRVFEEVFDMAFTVNMNALTLSLESPHTMPVEEAAQRAQSRRLVEAREVSRAFLPLEYDRERRVAGIGFLDYNIMANLVEDNPSLSYNLLGGAELLGGDIQGNVIGSWANEEHNVRTSNLRWRYVRRDTPWFSTFQAGQMGTTGLISRSIRGLSVSNEPIEPRRIFESYIIDGSTEPDSEVELYLNNRLIDFRRADASGYYRFEFPLTYGTTQLTVQIYTPSGETRVIDRRLQIPFTFLPRGEISYNIQGGQTETFLGGESERWLVHGDVSFGVTDWLTARLGSEYIHEVHDDRPFFYGSLSGRVLSQYLVNLDLAPDAFYRGVASVMYPSGRSISLQYTYFEDNPLYGIGGLDHEVQASFFSPFSLGEIPMGFRLAGDYRAIGENSATRYRSDLSMRLGRIGLRASYRDVLFYADNTYSLGQGHVSGSLTYTFMRSPGLPVFVRGMFLRGNLSYSLANDRLEDLGFQLSRTIRQWGRINLNANYDFRAESFRTRLGLILDLTPVRSTTNWDMRSDRMSVQQTLRGSLGFDREPDRIIASNRNQVGRAGASVILFVDNNNSGTFDEGDEIIPARAIRLDRSAQMVVERDGIIRISQLQSYFRYNVEVIRQALPNPLLVPSKEGFSFIADPNQYKRIEIPFYRSGVIDGTVSIVRDGVEQGQGGLRLLIKGVDLDFSETVRNFSDGSYYAMDLPPGHYTIEVDPVQMDFLGAHMPEGPKEFRLRPMAEGDFIEDLNILLMPKEVIEEEPEPPAIEEEVPVAEAPVVSPPADETYDFEEAAIGDQYYVALNRFSTIYRAETARRMAAERLGMDLFIHFLEEENLFLVYSVQMEDPSEARDLLDKTTEAGFTAAFVGSAPLPGLKALRYTIQIDSFRTETEATEEMQSLSKVLNLPLQVEYEELTGRYTLRTEPYANIPEAQAILQQIRWESGLVRAFLTSIPRIPAVPVIMTFGPWE